MATIFHFKLHRTYSYVLLTDRRKKICAKSLGPTYCLCLQLWSSETKSVFFFVNCANSDSEAKKQNQSPEKKYNLDLLLKYVFVRYFVLNSTIGQKGAHTSQWDTDLLIQTACTAGKEHLPWTPLHSPFEPQQRIMGPELVIPNLLVSPCFFRTPWGCSDGKLEKRIKWRNSFLCLSAKMGTELYSEHLP